MPSFRIERQCVRYEIAEVWADDFDAAWERADDWEYTPAPDDEESCEAYDIMPLDALGMARPEAIPEWWYAR